MRGARETQMGEAGSHVQTHCEGNRDCRRQNPRQDFAGKIICPVDFLHTPVGQRLAKVVATFLTLDLTLPSW